MTERPRHDIATDLVEYLVLVLPGLHTLPTIADELSRLVANSAIRILDMVVIRFDENGSAEAIEAESIECLAPLHNSSPYAGALLSRHDIELVSLALLAPSAAIIVVAEDRWAESLSVATRGRGRGQGRRTHRSTTRGVGTLARAGRKGAIVMIRHTRAERDEVPDLLTRPPSGTREFVAEWAHVLVDPVGQLQQLADLHGQGFLSQDEFERYKLHVSGL